MKSTSLKGVKIAVCGKKNTDLTKKSVKQPESVSLRMWLFRMN